MHRKIHSTYYMFICLCLFFIILAFVMDTPTEILLGFKKILFESNILITDYIELAGIGATFINMSLVVLASISLLIYVGIKPNGSTIAALFTMAGFSLFGKNIVNIWPIILGIWLYSKYQKEKFINYVLIALFATTLSPTVNELSFSGHLPFEGDIIIGILLSTFIGFIFPPMAAYCLKLHQGYNLYNIGFAAGLLATLLMSLLRAFGINFESRLLWSTGNNLFFSIILICLFIVMIIVGYIDNGKNFKTLFKLYKQPGRLVSDYYLLFGRGITMINMGILGIYSTSFLLVIGGDLNGPTIGGILTIVGFGAFGKHLKNVFPVMIGATLSSLLNIWPINSPSMVLGILFSSTLAPISGQFGLAYGCLAGFLHICLMMNLAYLHGGLNLYNNGFAGGMVCIILIPIITAFRKELK
ncbi:DUF1576 domain-containing protein [Clostridium tagluense]|uniref:DUF1576 domain-containing protein n=1 Tax=Clostridium TaxID=1485 RepID=UPI0013E91CA0|nr:MULTISPECIES: DUF1576 domain-containing protein [Clostridium]MBW9159526.1 DUF1576 domain-containing protein [Clostridium tagluense]MBZ9621347.1 DUF1576 domain-containing protein [Clostridium sp. FP2]MCB2314171.1 DUF1576 domain-containing protein [Clostridium tagluense]MCB2318990.1 DUF1576 domain-containing protein [Clostridium tagluense]MCB2323896.1 DUF1576 domain-containing protein [Clostridium tagluense]